MSNCLDRGYPVYDEQGNLVGVLPTNQGIPGPEGQQGIPGEDGQPGPEGDAGQDGQDGQDGVIYRFGLGLVNAQQIQPSSVEKVEFDGLIEFVGASWDEVNFRLTPTVAGFWQITLALRYQLLSGGYSVQSRIHLNGNLARYDQRTTDASYWPIPSVTRRIPFNGTTDYIEAFAWQSSPSACDIMINHCVLEGFFLG